MEAEMFWRMKYCAAFMVGQHSGMALNDVNSLLKGSQFELDEYSYEFFYRLFTQEASEIEVGIEFPSVNQEHEVRDLIRKLAFGSVDDCHYASRQLAGRLAFVTDRRSPPGLFITVVGEAINDARVLMWKFPSDEIIQASPTDSGLTIRLAQGAFSRKQEFYKVAVFQGQIDNSSFWRGHVEDKQARQNANQVSDYWVSEFLQAKPDITNKRGTRILAKALREVLKRTDDINLKENIIRAAMIIKVQNGIRVTIRSFADTYLSSQLRDEFLSLRLCIGALDSIFLFDSEEFAKYFGIKSIELNGSFIISGPSDSFDEVVTPVPDGTTLVSSIVYQGVITNLSIK